ncbi:hypothetical protein PM022_19020, partial [Halorubrum ezzemoulense]|nr:hypothetical protein [Halorubrum ezzemoulense]
MAFVKQAQTGEYVESADNLLESIDVKGLLFVDELARETSRDRTEDVKIIQFPESPGSVV